MIGVVYIAALGLVYSVFAFAHHIDQFGQCRQSATKALFLATHSVFTTEMHIAAMEHCFDIPFEWMW